MIKASTHTYSKFYSHLAYLFYAVAAADHHIKDQEVKALHAMVLEDWVNLESSKDEFGTDAAFEIESFFDLIREKGLHADKAFEVFEKYYHENNVLFDADVVSRIYHTCTRMTFTFEGTNKTEMAMIQRVHLLMGTTMPR